MKTMICASLFMAISSGVLASCGSSEDSADECGQPYNPTTLLQTKVATQGYNITERQVTTQMVNLLKSYNVTEGYPDDEVLLKMYDFCQCDKPGPYLCPTCDPVPPKKNPHYKVTWVVVSEHMTGFLAGAVKCNRPLVDDIIVITSPEDQETQSFCGEHGITCHVTTALHEDGKKFNKGKAMREVQYGLHQYAKENELVLFVDSDICLSPDLWDHLPAYVDSHTLYSAVRRCIFKTPGAYSNGWPAVEEHAKFSGMGFLQLYKASPDAPLYDPDFPTAAGCDLEFNHKFPTVQTLDLHVLHMGSTCNWEGFRGSSSEWYSAQPPPPGACGCCDHQI